ncbi:hypothetical protein [Fictibacillus phosphorivorans]|uniref:hypothetical protein n=1 Tax=Fictibacillus phosphorivorans TaxID=1221500 RepID=UPI0011A89C50|nr:hypothetical protein [Fictibacillus phosphorivorans]
MAKAFFVVSCVIGENYALKGEKRMITGEKISISGVSEHFSGGHSLFTGERVINIKTRTVKHISTA